MSILRYNTVMTETIENSDLGGKRQQLMELMNIQEGEQEKVTSFSVAMEKLSEKAVKFFGSTPEIESEKLSQRFAFVQKVLDAFGYDEPVVRHEDFDAIPRPVLQLPEAAWNKLISWADLVKLGLGSKIPQEIRNAAGLQ